MLNATLRRDIIEHAAEEYPKECCGVIVDGKYYQCRNIASDPTEEFRIHPADHREFEGRIQAYVHSHPDGTSKMSQADRVYMEHCGKPYIILAYPIKEFGVYAPSGYKAPLVGRTFIHGVLDCYGLVKDFYERELGVTLPEFEREDKWWDSGDISLYEENFEKAGFYKVDDLQYGDMIVCQVDAPVPNHALIYLGENVDLKSENAPPCIGVNMVLHHLYGRKSTREIYGVYWESKTKMILRHKEVK